MKIILDYLKQLSNSIMDFLRQLSWTFLDNYLGPLSLTTILYYLKKTSFFDNYQL